MGKYCKNITGEVCKENLSMPTQQRNVARKLRLLRTREYNRVQQSCIGGQTSLTTSHTIPENERNVVSYNIYLVKKLDRDQTLYNKMQHNTTRYNKVAKRVQHFIQHQSCMMLYEMLYSFGRSFRLGSNITTLFVQHTVIFSLVKQGQRGRGRKQKCCTDNAIQFDPQP